MIAYAITDLLFATRIKSTAESLDVPARPARTPERLAELLRSPDADDPPVKAVIIDLEMDGDPLEMIRVAKSGDGRRQAGDDIRVIAFGPHVQTELLTAARNAGANDVMPRSRFAQELPRILEGARD